MKQLELNTKHKKDGFAVPKRYFENLKTEVLQKTYPKKSRIIALNSSFMRYAAVLMVGLLVAGGWYFINHAQDSSNLYADMVESEIYMYEYAMLDEYSSFGLESELTSNEDELFLNSEYGDEVLMYDSE